MRNNSVPSAVTYILSGSLLHLYGSVGSGWSANFIAIFGFVIFYLGLSKMQHNLDNIGWKAASILKWAAIIGFIAAFTDLIPLSGWIASLGYITAFVIELVGLFKMRNSKLLNKGGKNGVTMLLIAIISSIVQAILGLIPFFGDWLAAPFSLAALLLIFFGWTHVQDGVIEEV